jgi:tetratricopeptide (TPR) repeat protein
MLKIDRRLVAVSLATLLAAACGPSIKVETHKPGRVSTGVTEQVVLADSFGRITAQDQTARALRDAFRSHEWFTFSDRSDDVTLDIRAGEVELASASDVPERSLVIRVDAVEFFTHETVETRRVTEDGETFDAAIPVLEAVTLFQITAADDTGFLILDQVEYEARVAQDISERPLDDDLLERATVAAINAFVADISPERVSQTIPLDGDDVRLNGAVDLAVQGQLDVAQTEIERFIEDHPSHAGAHYNLGAVLDAQRDFEGALEVYAQALELEANSMYAETRGECQQRLDWAVELGR